MKNLYIIFAFLLLSCGSTIVLEDNTVSIVNDNAKKTANSGKDTLWYHPNPWWKVVAEPFPVSADSFAYRLFFPQYGYPKKYENGKWADSTFRRWSEYNKFTSPKPLYGHFWHILIQEYKDSFQKHPEYLAEINGKRPGYGKVSKFCVTNPAVAELYKKYIFKKVETTKNDSITVSIEPSDGEKYCTCSRCSKLGSISNQVYYFANTVAELVVKKYPKVTLNLFPYYKHALVPDFKIHPNILITVAPNGFQEYYSPQEMILAWKGTSKNLTIYDYFGIPQWTGDMPRIPINDFIKMVDFSKQNGYKGFIYESGVNFNATILLYLWNRYLLSPETGWETIFNKFIEDCFPSCKTEMHRLFSRWHTIWLEKDEIPLALYDLKIASSKVKDANELERLRDIKAYVHYIILYLDWNNDRKNQLKTQELFNYILQSNNRITCNYNAISEIILTANKEDALLKKKMAFSNFYNLPLDKIQLNPMKIEANFNTDLKTNGAYEKILDTRSPNKIISELNILEKYSLQKITVTLSNSTQPKIYAKEDININLSSIKPRSYNQDSTIWITVQSEDYSYIKTYTITKNKVTKIEIPEEGLYSLYFNRIEAALAEFTGNFIMVYYPKKGAMWSNLKYYYPDTNNILKEFDLENPPSYRYGFGFLLGKIPPKQ